MSDLLLLCYHAVSERWPAALSVTPRQLSDHMSLLVRKGYQGVTLREAISGPTASRSVAITFDDAYRSVFELARPILADAGFVGSVYAPTSFIGSEEPMSFPGVEHWLDSEHRAELVPMSWGELADLANAGWEVGSHTRTHARLTELDAPSLDAELRDSREELERQMGCTCQSLAYPYGAHDGRVIEAAAQAGYTVAAGTLPGRLKPPTGPLDWPRIVVNHVDSARRFQLKTSRATRTAKATPAWDLVAKARRQARRSA